MATTRRNLGKEPNLALRVKRLDFPSSSVYLDLVIEGILFEDLRFSIEELFELTAEMVNLNQVLWRALDQRFRRKEEVEEAEIIDDGEAGE